jgi:hypothetical protein
VPSRAPWIIVGVLVVVAIAGGVAAFQIRAHRAADGQIAVPAGGATAVDDNNTPTESAASASATAARRAPPPRPVKQRNPDDPYDDVPVVPRSPRPPSKGPAPYTPSGL